jgi:hypothetical protein
VGRIVRRRVAIAICCDGPDWDAPRLRTILILPKHIIAQGRVCGLFERLPADLHAVMEPKADDLAGQVARLVDAGDVVLVKGSRAAGCPALRWYDHETRASLLDDKSK